jgi:type IX secretion system substrate protein
MKKIYVLLMLLPLYSLKAQTVPTCSLNSSFIASGKDGIYPDSALNFVNGTVGQPYLQDATIVIHLDTVVSGQTCTYSTINLQSSSNNYGLPPGLSLAGTPSNFKFPGNDSSCMIIYGTPTTAGSYTLTFVLKVYCTQFGPIPADTYTLGYYHITISAAAGIETNMAPNYGFQVMQNSPNPVISSTTNVKFTTPADGKAKMSVFNITGQKMADKEFMVQRGDNSYDFDTTILENGIYLYSIEFNGQKQVRRMVVTK